MHEPVGHLTSRLSLLPASKPSRAARPEGPAWVWASVVLVWILGMVAGPVLGWLDVTRLPAVAAISAAVALLVGRIVGLRGPSVTAIDRWEPSRLAVGTGLLVSTIVLGWVLLTRFWSAELNALDFTVYFDRPCFQTMAGRPLFIETADVPEFSSRGQLAHHAYWGLFAVCAPYLLWPSPYWLLAVTVLAPVAGAWYVLRILRRIGAGGFVAAAGAVAFLLNDNTARAIGYGFHPEMLYAWLIPWMLDAGLSGRRRSYLAAAIGCVLVKEDAVFVTFAVSTSLALHRWSAMTVRDRWTFLAVPVAVALANLIVYVEVVQPWVSTDPLVYGHYWRDFGATPWQALGGMVTNPAAVLGRIVASPFIALVLMPHLLLPIVGWRWAVGVVPIVALYATSSSEQVRSFGVYYAVLVVPFLAIGAAVGARSLARLAWPSDARANVAAGVAIVAGALVVGSGDRGYSLRPWSAEVASIQRALAHVRDEDRVLVQSAIYPHVGYDARWQLLTRATLEEAANAGTAVILAPRLGAFPFATGELAHHPSLEIGESLPGGLVIARTVGNGRHSTPGTPGGSVALSLRR